VHVGQVTIDLLSENDLLEIFDFYMLQARRYPPGGIMAWHTLIHVCRYWRKIVFGSPLRLDLKLLCTAKTPVRDTLDVWPALPIRVLDYGRTLDLDNILAVLEHRDRICEIALYDSPNLLLEKVFAALIREPFPALTQLELVSYPRMTPAVPPDPFSGGSTPRLRHVSLDGITFPELPKLLLSATHLVNLTLATIPHSAYISPEAMVTYLSALTSLEELHLEFQSPEFLDLKTPRPHLPTRSVLPSLTTFGFRGVNDYLEDFVSRIDAPRLERFSMAFFNQFEFDTSQVVHFISRTSSLKAPDEAHVSFEDGLVYVTYSYSSQTPGSGQFEVGISGGESDFQLSSLALVCSSFSPHLSTVENLYIKEYSEPQSGWEDDVIENTQWLGILRPFTTVKNLYLCERFAPRVAPALQELVEEGTTEVLPILQNIFVEGFQQLGPVEEGISQFVAARELSGHPIAVSGWVITPWECNDSPVFVEYFRITL
jgi:hypothetical protein